MPMIVMGVVGMRVVRGGGAVGHRSEPIR
jgi:hypothetical protein